MIRWLYNIGMAILGRVDAVKYREALEFGLQAKSINERLQRALDDQKQRADTAERMLKREVKA